MKITKLHVYPLSLVRNFFISLGEYSIFMFKTFKSISSWNTYFEYNLDQMIKIGVQSVPIVILTSLFSGMVTSVQAAYQFELL